MLRKLQNLFGRNKDSSKKSKSIPITISDPGWNKARSVNYRDADFDVHDPYRQNVFVYAAIRAQSVNIAGVDFNLKDRRSGKDIENRNDPWVKLFKKPHQLMEGSQLFRATVIHYELHGSCFWLLNGPYGLPIQKANEIPTEILPLGPDRIVPRYAKEDKNMTTLLGWSYVVNRTLRKTIPLEFWQVLRFYEYNPESLALGFTGLKPSELSVDIDYKSHKFNQAFFSNGADVGGVLRYTGEDLDENELENMREVWDSRHVGVGNAKRTPILTNGFDYKETGRSHKDMEYKEQYKIGREEIIASFNVPKQQVSLYEDINFATARVSDKAFWTNNLIPKMKYLCSVINNQLLELTQYECYFDLSKVEALNYSMDEKLSNAERYQKLGFPLNEINRKLNLGMDEINEDWANTAIDTRKAGESTPDSEKYDPSDYNNEDDKSASDIELLIKAAVEKSQEKSLIANTEIGTEDLSNLSTQELYEMSLTGHEKATDLFVSQYMKNFRVPVEKKMIKKINGYILKLKKEQLKNFDTLAQKSVNKALEEGDVDQVLFDKEKWGKTISEMALPFHKEAFDLSIKQLESELGGFTIFSPGSPEVAEKLSQVNLQITQVNDTISRSIRESLVEGVILGESIDEMRARIVKQFEGLLNRAGNIATTEVGKASSTVKYLGMQKENVMKKWLSSRDTSVRDTHVDYNKVAPQEMDYEYAPGLKYPLDPNGAPSEICQCRCVLVSKRRK